MMPNRSGVDIRDHTDIRHADIVALNFMRPTDKLFFRRHYRHGLRSHIMEVLDARERRLESEGLLKDGLRFFPRARPRKMLRLFRRRFDSADKAMEEIHRLQILDHYLTPAFYAPSDEFIVDYQGPAGYTIMLCGLQEYVFGEDLDPWHHNPENQLPDICHRLTSEPYHTKQMPQAKLLPRIRQQVARFIEQVKRMAKEAHHIPDLAGIGNILVTAAAQVKLVDINNVSRLWFDHRIRVDDKGYPVCDKSIEALSLLEKHVTRRIDIKSDPVYRMFLDPQRMQEVRRLELSFKRAFTREDQSGAEAM